MSITIIPNKSYKTYSGKIILYGTLKIYSCSTWLLEKN